MPQDLAQRSIFLSASVPLQARAPIYHVLDNQVDWIEEAVIAVARAVLGQRGQLVFGAHPSISPLVAMVAGEYIEPVPRVHIYQSRAYEGYIPDETSAMVRAGLAVMHWIDAADGERFNPSMRGQPQCQASLRAMREAMLRETAPAAMVGIGGMEGVEDEAELFADLRPGQPIFLLQSTGGATRLLASADTELEALLAGDAAEAATRIRAVREKIGPYRHVPDDNVRLQAFFDSSAAFFRTLDQVSSDLLRQMSPPYAFIANDMIADIRPS